MFVFTTTLLKVLSWLRIRAISSFLIVSIHLIHFYSLPEIPESFISLCFINYWFQSQNNAWLFKNNSYSIDLYRVKYNSLFGIKQFNVEPQLKFHYNENKGIFPSKHFCSEVYITCENVLKTECKNLMNCYKMNAM